MATKEQIAAIDNVGSRLLQMRQHWEEAVARYFDPARFLLTVQACITVSRTVSFIIQSNKSQFPDFDSWYEPHRKKMAADPVMTWARDARNMIEKQGDLKAHSLLRGEIIASYYEGPASDWVPADLFATPETFFRAVPSEFRRIRHIVENGTLLIERRWVDDKLPDYELLEALAHVYEVLGSIVVDLFKQVGVDPPRAVSDTKPYSMASLAMDRALYLSMKDGSQVGMRILRRSTSPDEKMLLRRYGDQRAKWEKIKEAKSFREIAEAYFLMARHLMITDGFHRSFMFLLKGTAILQVIGTEHPDRATRYVMMRDLAKLAGIVGADGVMMINEAWTAHVKDAPNGFAAEARNRGEVLNLTAANANCESYALSAKIIRKLFKKHKVKRLEPTILQENPTIWLLYPFQKIWGCVDEQKMFEAEKNLIEQGANLAKWTELVKKGG